MQSLFVPCFLAGARGMQLIVIIIVAIIVFGGAKNIPKIMRNMGKGVHSFRQGLEDAKEEMYKEVKKAEKPASHKADDDDDTHDSKPSNPNYSAE